MKTAAALLPFLCLSALAQSPGAHWSVTPSGTNPSQRRENPGAADNDNMYVFGGQSGQSGGTRMNDLWKFDGSSWTEMTTDGAVGSPPQRSQAGVTWDFAINKLVVFGGYDNTGAVLDDVWTWDPTTNTWANMMPPAGPSARRFVAMTYDPNTSSVVMFGGLDASGAHLNDTWILIGGSTWIQMAPTTVPPERRQHHLVTRNDFGDVLMCGGQNASQPAPTKWKRDTWIWDGSDWSEIITTTLPASQVANDAAYDELRQRVVLASGNGSGGSPTALISEFDSIANDWVQRPLDPGIYKVSRYFAAYVPSLGKTFKASGQILNAAAPATNTYEFQSDVIADATQYGSGCSGPGGALTLTSDSRPWTERTWTGTCSNLGATSLALGVWGVNQAATPLQALLPIAGASCILLNDATILDGPLAPSAGAVDVSLPIPADPALSGYNLNVQVAELEFDASFNWVGLHTSNGLELTIGVL